MTCALVAMTGCGTQGVVTTQAEATPVIQTASLGGGTSGTYFSAAVQVSGGTAPYTFSVSSGLIPTGLTLSSAGVLSGTPTVASTYTFTISAKDANAQSTSKGFTVTIAPAAGAAVVSITTSALPAATVGGYYSATIAATGGSVPYSFAVTAGSLPAGLTLTPSGFLSGVPTTTSTSSFTVTVTDGQSQQASATFSITAGSAISLVTTTLPAGTVGTAYNTMLQAANGTAPYSYAVTSGALPAGLSLSQGGILSGFPTTAGTSSFGVTVTDAQSKQASGTFSITITSALTISTANVANGTVGLAYSATLQAVNGTQPYSFVISSGALPAGLSLTTNGVISGTPSLAGTSQFTVSVTDALGARANANYSITIAPVLALTTSTLPNGTAGLAYSSTLQSTNGVQPYTYTVSSGALPAGLLLSAAGVLSGTPTTAGTSTFAITVTDANSQKASANFSITIAPAVAITMASLPNGTAGLAYNATIAATNGAKPYSFAVTSGALPGGVNLSSSGVLSGTPSAAGTFNFTVTVTDANLQRASVAFSITIGPAVSITTSSLPAGIAGIAYNSSIAATGGAAPYSFAVTSGALPSGVNLSSDGVLSGTPSAAGTFNFTVTVTDANSERASATYAVTIAPAVSVTTTSLPAGIVGSAYSSTVAATGGAAPYSFAVTSGSLPLGLALTSSGTISGSPTTAGTSAFTITVTDANGQTAGMNFSVTVAPALTITTPALGSGQVGTAYSAQFYAANGTAPYTFSLTAGALPGGLMLSASGALAGTPTAAGTFNFTVGVADAGGQHATASYSLTITATNPLMITTPALGPGQVGNTYNAQFYAAGGTAPYTFAVTSGALPGGFTLASNGALAGSATTAGTFNFTITVTDANAQQASQTYSLLINSSTPLAITTPSLGPGYVGYAYSAQIYAANGTTPYAFTTVPGTLPPGFALTNDGALGGTPTTAGTYSFTITVTDATGTKASATYSLTITGTAAPLMVNNTTLASALVNVSYNAAIPISGGTALYTVTLTSGSLPTGISLSSAGALSGTASATGNYTFTVSVTDSSATPQTATGTLTLSVTSGGSATVQVNAASVLSTVPQSAYGIHTSVYDDAFYDPTSLPGLLQTTGTNVMRYPGGSYSDRYHWAQASITPVYASTNPACGVVQGEQYLAANTDFGHFVKVLQAVGAQALITINYGTSVANSQASLSAGNTGVANHCSEPNTAGQPQEAAAWVAYANGNAASTQVIGVDAAGFDWKTVGYWAALRGASPLSVDDGYNFLRLGLSAPIGIKYWEIGNEIYYNGYDGNRNPETDLHAPYIYPNGYSGGTFDSRAGVAALSPAAYGANAAAYIQAMKAVDTTIKIGVSMSSPVVDPISLSYNPDLMQSICASAQFDMAIIHYYPGTYQDVSASEMLGLPQTQLPTVVSGIRSQLAQYCPANASAIQVFLTETSPNGTVDGGVPNEVTGLFALNVYLSALQTGISNMDWLELHNGTYLTTTETPGPAYYGLQMANLLAGVGDSVVSASSSSSTVVAYATVKANGQKGVLLINADPSQPVVVQVTVSGATLGSAAMQYSYGVSTTQSAAALTGTSFSVGGNTFTVTVPAYTATEVIIP